MRHDIWDDRSLFESDPAQVEALLRCPAMEVAPLQDYVARLEAASGEDFGALRRLARNALISQPAREHLETRRLIAPFFSDRAMARWEPRFETAIDAALDRLATAPRPDLIDDFVTPLFLSVICPMVGLRDDGSGQMHRMIATVQRITEPMLSLRDLRDLNSAVQYLDARLPPEDGIPPATPECLSSYLHRNRDRAPATVELRYTAMALTVAASTAAQTLGFVLHGLLMEDARHWQDAATPGWAARHLDRFLSLYPSTLTLVRMASRDVVIGGCPFARGQATVIDVPATNSRLRDRTDAAGKARSLSFGAGAHKCPGEAVSRRLLALAVPALARRFPNMALHKDKVRFRTTAMVQFPVTMPCDTTGQSRRLSARLAEVKDLPSARAIVSDNYRFMPPAMEPHLRALAARSGTDLSPAILIARNAMFFMSGKRHADVRKVVAGCLGGNRLPVWQGLVDTQVQRALDGLAAAARPDLIHDFADPLFRGITGPILGVNTDAPHRFDQLAPILQDVLEPWLPMRELLRLQEVFAELLALMRIPPAPQDGAPVSVLGALMATRLEDFTRDDMKALVLVLYGASFNLSHTLGNVLHWILTRPPEDRTGAADPDWIAQHMERLISLCGSPKYIYRMVRQPVRLGGLDLRVGDTARLQLLSINRGIGAGHLAFGHGLHHCVGSGLSRMMLRTAVPALFARFPDLHLKPQAHEYQDMTQTVALSKLPCVRPPQEQDKEKA